MCFSCSKGRHKASRVDRVRSHTKRGRKRSAATQDARPDWPYEPGLHTAHVSRSFVASLFLQNCVLPQSASDRPRQRKPLRRIRRSLPLFPFSQRSAQKYSKKPQSDILIRSSILPQIPILALISTRVQSKVSRFPPILQQHQRLLSFS